MRLWWVLPAVLLSGCFWGDADGHLFVRVSSANYDQFEGVLYPKDRADAWREIFADRALVCDDGSTDCDPADRVPGGLLELYLPYETSRGRGLMTQKGDLQVTVHLDVGDAYRLLEDDEYGGWSYLTDADRLEGVDGDGCAVDSGSVRSGVGRCLRAEVEENVAAYRKLDEDIRLVVLVNLLGEDDVRSTACQDALDRDAWSLPTTLKVNYNAEGPIELTPGGPQVYATEDAPIPTCDIEVFTQVQLGQERFSGDWFGQDAETPGEFPIDWQNGDEDPKVGTVELASLTLPGDGKRGQASGRLHVRYTSESFSGRDGKLLFDAGFDVAVQRDPVQVDEPDRQVDLGPDAGE